MPFPKCGSRRCVVWGCAAFLLMAVAAYFFCPWCRPAVKPCCKEHAAANQLSMDEEEMSVEDEVENIYVLIQQMNAREYTTMDTMIRIFHYVKPHKGPTHGCPECAEIHDRTNNVDTVTISRDQWNKFKKLEMREKALIK